MAVLSILPSPRRLFPARVARFLPAARLPTPTRFQRLLARVLVVLALLFGCAVLYLRHVCLLGGYPGVYGGSCFVTRRHLGNALEAYAREPFVPLPTVHLVMASTTRERVLGKTKWATPARIASLLSLPVANVEVKKYVADDPMAEFSPRFNRGHEVAMYLSYVLAHYDRLPDLVLFVHAEEFPWHVDPLLLGSLPYLLSRLDLTHVRSRGFANLRVSWREGCPDWINTTVPAGRSTKKEEPFMRQAWADNFLPSGVAHKQAPEILAAPCCNQFAVTRDALLRSKRAQYERSLGWLQSTSLNDDLAGRVWERLFQFLFTGNAVDCPLERRAYCAMYRICLDAEDWREYAAAEDEDVALRRSVRNVWSVLWRPFWGWTYTARLASLGDRMSALRRKGLVQGQMPAFVNSTADVYSE